MLDGACNYMILYLRLLLNLSKIMILSRDKVLLSILTHAIMYFLFRIKFLVYLFLLESFANHFQNLLYVLGKVELEDAADADDLSEDVVGAGFASFASSDAACPLPASALSKYLSKAALALPGGPKGVSFFDILSLLADLAR